MFSQDVIQPLMDMADPNHPLHQEIQQQQNNSSNGIVIKSLLPFSGIDDELDRSRAMENVRVAISCYYSIANIRIFAIFILFINQI